MKRFFAFIIVAALAVSSSFAQMGGGMGGSSAMNPVFTKLFGGNKAFSAQVDVKVQGDSPDSAMNMTMNMAMLDGKTRAEMDMSKMSGGQMPPNALAQMKQMGMDKIIAISQPDDKKTLVIYPGLKAYAEMPMDSQQVTEATKKYKVDKTSLGKEAVDGHDCEKNKVILTDDKGATHEATVWNASDLKDFPVQMQMSEQGTSVMMKYKNIKLDKPDSSQFDAPSGYTKYASMQEMMQTEMMKHMGGGPGGPGGSGAPGGPPPGGQ